MERRRRRVKVEKPNDIATTDFGDGVSGTGVNRFFGDRRGGFSEARTIALAALRSLVAADLDGGLSCRS